MEFAITASTGAGLEADNSYKILKADL